MITLADGAPQLRINDHDFSDSEIKLINEKIQAWAKERKCVNCKYFNKSGNCEKLGFIFSDYGHNYYEFGTNMSENEFSCQAWKKKK